MAEPFARETGSLVSSNRQAPAPEAQSMYDAEGVEHQVPIADVGTAYQGGLSFANDATVHLKRGDRIEQVSGADAARILGSSEGNTTDVAAPSAYRAQREADTYGGAGGAAENFGAHALDQTTLGLSSELFKGAGYGHALGALDRQNPNAGLAGDVVGALAPAVVTGGESLFGTAAKAGGKAALGEGAGLLSRGAGLLTAPARGAAAAGRAAEGLVAGDGLLARTARATVGQAVEGGLQGVGQGIAEAARSDDDLDAEKLFATAAKGALLGGAVGGGLSLVGSGVGAATGALTRKVGEGLDHVAESARGTFGGAASAVGKRLGIETAGDAATAVTSALPRAEYEALGLLGKATGYGERKAVAGAEAGAESLETSLLGRREAVLSDVEKDTALRSVGATQAQRAELAAMGPEAEALATKQLTHDVPEALGKPSLARVTREEMREAAPKVAKKYGEKIGGYIKRLDDLPAEVPRPDVARILADVHGSIIEPLNATAGVEFKRVAKQVESYLRDFRKTVHTPTFGDLQKARVSLDRVIRQSKIKGDTIKGDAFGKLRDALEGELTKSADAASSHLGADFVAKYRAAKFNYSVSKRLEKWAEKGASRDAANRFGGLSEQLAALGGGGLGKTVGAGLGGLFLGPLGAAAGGLVGGLGGAAAAHYGRMYGAQTAAVFAKEARELGYVPALARRAEEILPGAGAVVEKGAAKVGAAAPGVAGQGVQAATADGKGVAAVAHESTRLESAALAAQAKASDIVKHVTHSFDERVAQPLADFFGRAREGYRKSSFVVPALTIAQEQHARSTYGTLTQQYQRAREQDDHAAAQAETRGRVVGEMFASAGPGVATKVAAMGTRATDYLASQAPTTPSRNLLTPGLSTDDHAPSASAMAKYLRVRAAVDDPASVIERLASKNDVTPEEIQAVKAVYPRVFAEVQAAAQEHAVELKNALPYVKELALSRLLGVPIEASMRPGFAQQIQKNAFGPPSPASGGPPASGGAAPARTSRPLDIAGNAQTPGERLAQGSGP